MSSQYIGTSFISMPWKTVTPLQQAVRSVVVVVVVARRYPGVQWCTWVGGPGLRLLKLLIPREMKLSPSPEAWYTRRMLKPKPFRPGRTAHATLEAHKRAEPPVL